MERVKDREDEEKEEESRRMDGPVLDQFDLIPQSGRSCDNYLYRPWICTWLVRTIEISVCRSLSTRFLTLRSGLSPIRLAPGDNEKTSPAI